MAITLSFIAGLSTLLGSIFIFINIKEGSIRKFISFCLSLSLMIMILISITELLPESLKNIFTTYSFPNNIISLILISVLAYTSITILDRVGSSSNSLYKLGILNALVLILHNMPEGMITYLSTINNSKLGIKLCTAIILHNIPEGIAIAVPIYYGTKSKIKALKMTLISGLAEPFGAIITSLLIKDTISSLLINNILLFVGVIMITLSINKLFPEAKQQNEDKYMYLGFITGIILLIIIEIYL